MQWLINLIAEKVWQNMQGMILLWSGSESSIPTGWHLCDGTNGTPDLKAKFIRGSGGAYVPGSTGGYTTHRHYANLGNHDHSIDVGTKVALGTGFDDRVTESNVDGYTNYNDSRPPFYTLAYIMKL